MDMSTLPKASELASFGVRAPCWSPGLPCALHSEIFAEGREASGVGMALALALDGLPPGDERRVLWVQDAPSIRLTGRPYRPGLPAVLRRRLIHVAATNCEDALFAIEEALRCRELACVIGEIAGNPRAFDFTASRRLSLTAEKHAVPLFLVRLDAERDLSAARMRWRVGAAPSFPPRWNAQAPGSPAWRAELFRSRAHAPGEWILHDDGKGLAAERLGERFAGTPDHGDLVAATGD
jgi:protein ImuA